MKRFITLLLFACIMLAPGVGVEAADVTTEKFSIVEDVGVESVVVLEELATVSLDNFNLDSTVPIAIYEGKLLFVNHVAVVISPAEDSPPALIAGDKLRRKTSEIGTNIHLNYILKRAGPAMENRSKKYVLNKGPILSQFAWSYQALFRWYELNRLSNKKYYT